MNTQKLSRIILIITVIFINIGCDQVSKKVVREKIAPYETISLLNQHLTVTNVENPGAFLSLGDSLKGNTKNVLLTLLPALALVLGLVYVITKQHLSRISQLGICFIIGGGIGNLFDRITYGSVTDFLHIRFGSVQTGIFNMADVSIVTGVLLLILHSILKKKAITVSGEQ